MFHAKSDGILDCFRSGGMPPERIRSPRAGEFCFGAFGEF